MTAVIYVLINLGEVVLVSNSIPMFLYPNFSLFLCFAYIHSIAVLAANLIHSVSFITYFSFIFKVTQLTTYRIIRFTTKLYTKILHYFTYSFGRAFYIGDGYIFDLVYRVLLLICNSTAGAGSSYERLRIVVFL